MQNQTTVLRAEGPTHGVTPHQSSNLVVSTTPYRSVVRRPQIWHTAAQHPAAQHPAAQHHNGETHVQPRYKDNYLRAS
jgi:hypothetical protein